MRLLFDHDRTVADFVARLIPHMAVRVNDFGFGEVFGVGAAIGVLNDRQNLVAGVVFHNYDPYVHSIEVSCAATSKVWAETDIVRAILRYPFVQLGCQRCTAVTPRKATSPRRFLESLGFKREGSVRRGFGDDNAIVYGLLREEWAQSRYGPQPVAGGLTDGEKVGAQSAHAA